MSLDVTCPGCGHPFYNEWELLQHANGRHHYRAWRPEDARRIAEDAERRRTLTPSRNRASEGR
jgi:uncharacterized C2H2 Zn-finger protein